MRISDWSSDVCSSDLRDAHRWCAPSGCLDFARHERKRSGLSLQPPVPAEGVAVHDLDARGAEFVAERVGGGEILGRARFLAAGEGGFDVSLDRKSTRLNSSH